MRATKAVVLGLLAAGCAGAAATNVRAPLAASLTAGAKTGAPVPLRADPNTKVILSNASNLPAASYHAAQAARGKDVFENTCGACHQREEFIGQAFVESWNDRRVWDFFSLVRGTMPLDNPGGLKPGEYVDLVAYLLEQNRAAPGPDSLKADTASMRGTKIAVKLP